MADDSETAGDVTDWAPVLQDLVDLDLAGAGRGVRAIIAARHRQVQAGQPEPGTDLYRSAMALLDCYEPDPARAAALLAAWMDQGGP